MSDEVEFKEDYSPETGPFFSVDLNGTEAGIHIRPEAMMELERYQGIESVGEFTVTVMLELNAKFMAVDFDQNKVAIEVHKELQKIKERYAHLFDKETCDD